jgi:hypothetical protein
MLQALMLLWPFGLLMIHFSLFRIVNFEVTVAVLICTLIVLYLFISSKIKIGHLFVASGILIYALVPGFFAQNPTEYFRSLLLFTNLMMMMILSSGMSLPVHKVIERSVTLFLRLSFVVAIFVILQTITLNIFDTFILLNPFGPFSSPGPGGEVYEPSPLALLKRPNGIFSEPSVVGWFMTFATAVALSSPVLCTRTKWLTAFACAVAAISSLSMSGFINIGLLSLVYLYINRTWDKVRMVTTSIILGMILMMTILFISLGLSNRFSNLFIEGTSAYYRVTAPMMLLSDSLPEYPFGHPLGQTDYIEPKDYMVNWAKGSTTNIDNSFFMVSFYFGILGIYISFILLSYSAFLILKRSLASLIVVSIVLALSETGALWGHSCVIIIGYSIILIRFILYLERSKIFASKNSV